MADHQTQQFQKMLLRRKLIVAGVVLLIFVFLLLRNIASYALVRQIGDQLETSLEQRLETTAGLTINVINSSINNLFDPIDLQLLEIKLARVRNSSDLEAVYIIDRGMNIWIDGDSDRPSRGYILEDSLDINLAWSRGVSTSAIHTISGEHFKNAYAVFEDGRGNSAMLVVEANAGYFSALNFYYKSLYINSAVAAIVFIILTIFLVLATTRFLRTEERLQESQRLAAMGQMTATMAHEIRNPLGIIKASTDVLREKYQKQGERDELFEFVDDEIKRLGRLVSDFLAFSREPILNTQPADINVIIRDAVSAFTSEKDAVIEFAPAQEELIFLVDTDKLYQVLLNLLLNAWQAADGHGSIRITSREFKQRGQSFAEIVVQDEGPGFQGDVTKVFEPFFTTKTQGTGLGLAVCRTIIEKMEGRISAENAPGGGARIVLLVPINS